MRSRRRRQAGGDEIIRFMEAEVMPWARAAPSAASGG
jgi:hypothetical protein